MPDYTYAALDTTGQTTSGTITAGDSAEAAVRVRALGCYPVRIEEAQRAINAARPVETDVRAPARRGGKITRVHILLFTREMADLLEAGLPMDRAFSVLIEQTDHEPLRVMLTAMRADVRAGQPLSEALRKFPKEFPQLFVNMVRAGEVSGQLASVMSRLSSFMEKEQMRRSQILSVLTYPMVLIGVAITAVAFLLTFVIPQLAKIFADMGSMLPLPTRILISVAGFLRHDGLLIAIVVALGVYGSRRWVSTDEGRRRFDLALLQAPVFGALNEKVVSARLVRTLGTLLAGGVPILEAMQIASTAVGNSVVGNAVVMARAEVRQGETLHVALEKSGTFLPIVRHMTAVGEETGRLPHMLIRTADTLDFEVDAAMRRLTSLVEPAVVLLMGGFVAFVVLSILLPIFQANSIVK